MKLAIIGAGAMGTLFGGRLAAAGNKVFMIDVVPAVIDSIRNDGIILEDENGKHSIPAYAFKAENMNMDGCFYLAAAVFLLSIVWISSKVNYVQAFFVAMPTIGFVLPFCGETLGFNVGILPGVFLLVFACWLLYSGMAMMLHQATGNQVLPYIIEPKRNI